MATDREGPAAVARVRYSPEVGEAICERVAAGESLLSICREPGMPNPSSAHDWTMAHPEFGTALREAQRQARVAARRADLVRFSRARDNRGRWSTYTPEKGEEICRRIVEGETLIAIAADPEMPCVSTVFNWARRNPDFAEAYAEARRLSADWLADEARETALATTPEWVWADRLKFDAIRWLTARLAPKKYVERLVVAGVIAEAKAEAEAAEGGDGSGYMRVLVTKFERSPKDPSKVIAYPPRNAEEEARYIEAFGEPYSGPGPLSHADDWRLSEEHHQRRRRVEGAGPGRWGGGAPSAGGPGEDL